MQVPKNLIQYVFMSLKFVFSLIAAVLFSLNGFSQISGCTDPQALNYNPEATVNDGSCVYPQTSISPEIIVSSLPNAVNETSGLIYWNEGLWTQNDSGNEPEIYKLDTITGQVSQTIAIEDAQNIDWEDLAQDEEFIYIGAFGNNLGNRTDLKIYRIEKSLIPLSGNGIVPATAINFSYGDQTTFKKANRNNDYDCESLIAFGDSLYLFTKNWVNEQSRLYALPKLSGTYEVFPRDTLAADGLITGADLIEDGNEIVLCSYKNYSPFIWLLFDFQGNDFLGGNKRRINFTGMLGTQTEGVSYTYGKNVFISSEKTQLISARLFKLNTAPWTYTISTGNDGQLPDKEGFLLYPNPNNGSFRINLGAQCSNNNFLAELINSSGERVFTDFCFNQAQCTADFVIPQLPEGIYMLKFYNQEDMYIGKLMIAE